MRKRTEVTKVLMERSDWDFGFVVYEYSDTVGHQYGLHNEEWNEVYRAIDAELGALLESVDERTTLLVISDHGWKRYPATFSLGSWLQRTSGFCLMAPSLCTKWPTMWNWRSYLLGTYF